MAEQRMDGTPPTLSLEAFFEGRIKGWGFIEDRKGRMRRQFSVAVTGHRDGEALVLDERFAFDDGERQDRQWRLFPQGGQRYIGKTDDLIGDAHGEVAGNSFHWWYKINLDVGKRRVAVDFDDWMYLQTDDLLINRATIKKFGLVFGRITICFVKERTAAQQPQQVAAE